MYKKYFCTFADSRMKKSLRRIEKQVKNLNFFDKIIINNEKDLDQNFKDEFKDKLIKGSRGYGYWVWKPQIILQALREMNDGDILLYADAGCHLNQGGIERLVYYFEQTYQSKSGLFIFQDAKESDNNKLEIFYTGLEKRYTKMDMLKYFSVDNEKSICDSGQIQATAFLIKKCSNSGKNY